MPTPPCDGGGRTWTRQPAHSRPASCISRVEEGLVTGRVDASGEPAATFEYGQFDLPCGRPARRLGPQTQGQPFLDEPREALALLRRRRFGLRQQAIVDVQGCFHAVA